MTRLQGCGTALVTPFTKAGDIDLPALRSLVDWPDFGGNRLSGRVRLYR